MARTLLLATLLSGLLLVPLRTPPLPKRRMPRRIGLAAPSASGQRWTVAGRGRAWERPAAARSPDSPLASSTWRHSFVCPWLLFGALGDILDVLLALVPGPVPGRAFRRSGRLLDATVGCRPAAVAVGGGLTLTAAGMLLAGAWGQMDYQVLLVGLLPGLGFPLALFGTTQAPTLSPRGRFDPGSGGDVGAAGLCRSS